MKGWYIVAKFDMLSAARKPHRHSSAIKMNNSMTLVSSDVYLWAPGKKMLAPLGLPPDLILCVKFVLHHKQCTMKQLVYQLYKLQ